MGLPALLLTCSNKPLELIIYPKTFKQHGECKINAKHGIKFSVSTGQDFGWSSIEVQYSLSPHGSMFEHGGVLVSQHSQCPKMEIIGQFHNGESESRMGF